MRKKFFAALLWLILATALPLQALAQYHLDLTSTDKTHIAPESAAGEAIVIDGVAVEINAGDALTAAEHAAFQQVVGGGQQTLVLGTGGAAIGGTLEIHDLGLTSLQSLTIPQNVVAIHDAAVQSELNIAGNLVNNGTLFAISSSAETTGFNLNVLNFFNNANSLISTQLPTSYGSGFAPLNLNITAINDIVNLGTLASSGALNLSAGGSITNGSATVTQSLMQAAGNIGLVSGAGNIINNGTISSLLGNIQMSSTVATDLLVNNAGGRIESLSGLIDLQNESFAGKFNTSLLGGDLIAEQLNIFSGNGIATVDIQDLSGVLNITAGEAHVQAATESLVLGDITLSGDPTFYNTNGGVQISGNLSFAGAPLAIVASGDITTSGNASISTASNTGSGGAITLIAGAAFTTTGGADALLGSPDTTSTLTITGASGTGGSILVSSPTLSSIDSRSTGGGGNGGNITLVAFSNGTSGGVITLPTTSTIRSGGNGSGSNGNVTVIAGNTAGGSSVTLGAINTTGGATGTGVITIAAETPAVTAGTTITNGALSGGFTYSAPYLSGNIRTGTLTSSGTSNVIDTTGSTTIAGTISNAAGTTTFNSTLAHIDNGNTVNNPTGALVASTGNLQVTGGTITLNDDVNVTNGTFITSANLGALTINSDVTAQGATLGSTDISIPGTIDIGTATLNLRQTNYGTYDIDLSDLSRVNAGAVDYREYTWGTSGVRAVGNCNNCNQFSSMTFLTYGSYNGDGSSLNLSPTETLYIQSYHDYINPGTINGGQLVELYPANGLIINGNITMPTGSLLVNGAGSGTISGDIQVIQGTTSIRVGAANCGCGPDGNLTITSTGSITAPSGTTLGSTGLVIDGTVDVGTNGQLIIQQTGYGNFAMDLSDLDRVTANVLTYNEQTWGTSGLTLSGTCTTCDKFDTVTMHTYGSIAGSGSDWGTLDSNATLTMQSYHDFINPGSINDGGAITLLPANGLVIDGNITLDNGSLSVFGAGTGSISGNVDVAGPLNITVGTALCGCGPSAGLSISGNVTGPSGTILGSQGISITGSVDVGTNGTLLLRQSAYGVYNINVADLENVNATSVVYTENTWGASGVNITGNCADCSHLSNLSFQSYGDVNGSAATLNLSDNATFLMQSYARQVVTGNVNGGTISLSGAGGVVVDQPIDLINTAVTINGGSGLADLQSNMNVRSLSVTSRNINVNADILSATNITMAATSGGNLNLAAGSSLTAGILNVGAPGSGTLSTGNIQSNGSVTLTSTGTITTGSTLANPVTITANGGNIFTRSTGNTTLTGATAADGGLTMQANGGNVTVMAGGNITAKSTGNTFIARAMGEPANFVGGGIQFGAGYTTGNWLAPYFGPTRTSAFIAPDPSTLGSNVIINGHGLSGMVEQQTATGGWINVGSPNPLAPTNIDLWGGALVFRARNSRFIDMDPNFIAVAFPIASTPIAPAPAPTVTVTPPAAIPTVFVPLVLPEVSNQRVPTDITSIGPVKTNNPEANNKEPAVVLLTSSETRVGDNCGTFIFSHDDDSIIAASAGTVFKADPAARKLELQNGELYVVVDDQPMTVMTAKGQVTLPAHSRAIISQTSTVVRVANLSESSSIATNSAGTSFAPKPGEEIVLAASDAEEQDLIPADGLDREPVEGAIHLANTTVQKNKIDKEKFFNVHAMICNREHHIRSKGNTAKTNSEQSVPVSQAESPYRPISYSAPVSTPSAARTGAAANVGLLRSSSDAVVHSAGTELVVDRGEIIAAPQANVVIHAADVKVNANAGSVLWISTKRGITQVRNLASNTAKDVRLTRADKVLVNLQPGQEATLGASQDDIHHVMKSDGVSRRGIRFVELTHGTIAICDYSFVSALTDGSIASTFCRNERKTAEEERVSAKITKTAAIVTMITARRGPYRRQ